VQRTQRSGKRSVQAATNRLADPMDAPLIEPSNTAINRSRAIEAESDGSTISPGLRRGFARVVLLVAVGLLLVVLVQNRGAWWAALTAAAGSPASTPATPIATALAEAAAGTPDASVGISATIDIAIANRIGIISGHRGNDSGAVCPDGLTEAQVNFDAATRVASILRAQGYTVDVLDEFDTRLKGYRARALLSIHADSCADINELATGYKVARTYMSAIPDEEDKLVACVSERYKAATGLRFHRNTVTHDMLQYHAFRKVDVSTPSAIIELGFLNLDRELLTRKKDTVAKGVSEGLLCYLRGEEP